MLVRILLMPVRALRPNATVLGYSGFVSVRILLMPVRALRHVSYTYWVSCERHSQNPINARKGITTDGTNYCTFRLVPRQNPINARKGITTDGSSVGLGDISLRQNPINARKGITTHRRVARLLSSTQVRILLMPVRALRHISLTTRTVPAAVQSESY